MFVNSLPETPVHIPDVHDVSCGSFLCCFLFFLDVQNLTHTRRFPCRYWMVRFQRVVDLNNEIKVYSICLLPILSTGLGGRVVVQSCAN